MKTTLNILAASSGAIALIICLLLMSSCQTGADGKRHYVGPNVTGSVGYSGVSVSVTLWSELSAVEAKKPLGPITLPPTVLGVPIGTK